MSDKNKRSVLGPRGRRKLGLAKGENYKDPGGHHSGYRVSHVRKREILEQEGFGVFPQGWLANTMVKPKERVTTNDWEAAKLATPNKMDSLPKHRALNPFTDPMPWADGQPLPR